MAFFLDETGKRKRVTVFGRDGVSSVMSVEHAAELLQAGIIEINEVEGGGNVAELAPMHSWWDVNRHLHGSGD